MWSDASCGGCGEPLADIDPLATPDVRPFHTGMWSEEAVAKAWTRMERAERPIPFRKVAIATAVLVVLGILSPLSASGLFHWLDQPAADVEHGPAVFPEVPAAAPAERAISPRPAQGPVPVGQGHIGLAFEWPYDGKTWSWTFELDPALPEHYRAIERQDFDDAYAAFVLDTGDDRVMESLAARLRSTADARGWDDRKLLDFALAFVQSLPYATDDITSGFDEYPRYPLETLLDEGSDCEDTSILYASLVQQLGFEVVLLSPPGHLAVGVHLPGAEGNTVHEGTSYLYAETTSPGWRVGQVPDPYQGEETHVHGLEARPVLSRPDWTARWDGDRYAIAASIKNVGVEPARDLRLYAAFDAGEGQVWDQATCAPVVLEAGATARCQFRLRAPPEGEGSRLVVSAWALGVEPRTSQSEAFTA